MNRDLHSPDDLGQAYDLIVDRYSAEFVNAKVDGKWLAHFRSLLPPDAQVLDAGCGPGLQSEVLYKLGCELSGFDVSRKMITAAKERVPFAKFRVAGFSQIAQMKCVFDGILFSYSLLHVGREEAQEVLFSCQRVLRPGGFVALFLKEGVGERYIDAPLMNDARLRTCLWTPEDISSVLKELGYQIVTVMRAQPESSLEFQFMKLFVVARHTITTESMEKLRQIKLVMLDVDGTMTDGQKSYSASGLQAIRFDVKDGLGIALLRAAGVYVALVTSDTTDIAKIRADDLGVSAFLANVVNKASAVSALSKQFGINSHEVAVVGDDIWELPAFRIAGLGVAVADAVPELCAAATVMLTKSGGHGAVREFAEMVLQAKGIKSADLLPGVAKSVHDEKTISS